MSCPVNLQALPSGVFEAVFTPENVRGRTSMNSLTTLSFPKSRSALWDGSPAGEELRLGLCARRRPRLVLLEKALRLAQRHARHSNKPRLLCFLLGSVCVDPDGEGVTVTLDRFDPGRGQAGSLSRVPSALLPGDVVVPCCVSTQAETPFDAAVQSEAELHHCFKALQQSVSGRQTLDLSQLMRVRGHVVCSQQSDAAAFSLSWSAVCPSVSVEVQPVRAVPIIPTALLRSLTGIDRPAPPPHTASRHRGFLTMDQTRKLLLLLESDPKASNLPLVGLWLSGVTHVSNPQVWAWCVRFLYSSALQDRVLSESRCFLLVLFASTHRAPQFFQCRGPGPGPGPATQLDYQLLTGAQCVTLYQVVSVEGRTLQCELRSEDHGRQAEVFREAKTSFSRTAPPAAGLSVSDQDSGVEDEDLSPRPSPSPHAPAQQARRVQPSVPELSLLMDSSFTSNQNARQSPRSANRDPPPPPPAVRRKSAPPTRNPTASAAPRPAAAPPNHHSTPNSNLQESCSCCTTHTYNCTSIFSSPRLHPAPLPPSSNCHTPPPSSHPLSSLPLSSHNNTPPPLCSHHPAPLPPSSHHHTPPSSSQNHAPLTPSSHFNTPPPPCSHHPAPLPPSPHHNTPPPSGHHPAPLPPSPHHNTPPPSSHHPTTLSSSVLANSLSSLHHTPPPFSTHSPHSSSSPPSAPPPPCHCSHSPPAQWCGDSPSPHPSRPADSASPPRLFRPACVSQCCDQLGGGVPSDTYQRLLHQDRQLRLLQAQVQMLLEAQGRPQPSVGQVEAQTPKSTVSIAVGTGASLFWGDPVQSPLPPPGVPAPPPSYSSHGDPSVIGSAGRAEDCEAVCPPSGQNSCSVSGLQSPVLGESVSMYGEQQSFYHNLMTQVTSRLQESDSNQEVEEESRRRSLSESSQSRRKQSCGGDPVLSATVRQLQQLGVVVDRDDLTEPERRIHETVESSSTLASINPAAVLSRLSVSEPTASGLFSEGSVDLSLEANAIALRYLSDSQLSKLSVGGHAPRAGPAPNHSLMSASNMSLATRKYMRRYGLIEEEDEEQEEEDDDNESEKQEADVLNSKLLPQGQLMRGPRPKTQPLMNAADKENCSSKRPSLLRASGRQTDGSMGNILDLSRLRQLPKLF